MLPFMKVVNWLLSILVKNKILTALSNSGTGCNARLLSFCTPKNTTTKNVRQQITTVHKKYKMLSVKIVSLLETNLLPKIEKKL